LQQKEDSEEDSEEAKHYSKEEAKSSSISEGRGSIKTSKKGVYDLFLGGHGKEKNT